MTAQAAATQVLAGMARMRPDYAMGAPGGSRGRREEAEGAETDQTRRAPGGAETTKTRSSLRAQSLPGLVYFLWSFSARSPFNPSLRPLIRLSALSSPSPRPLCYNRAASMKYEAFLCAVLLASAACGSPPPAKESVPKETAKPAASAEPPPGGYGVYVTNETSGDLTVIDGAT